MDDQDPTQQPPRRGASDDGPTLQLPPRTYGPLPDPGPEPGMDMLAAMVCSGAALCLGFLSYRGLATRDLQLFMFDVGRFDALLGHWSDVVGFVYASACCLLSIAALRILTARRFRPVLAVPTAVLVGLVIPAMLAVFLAVLAAGLLAIFGIYALFFHAGDR